MRVALSIIVVFSCIFLTCNAVDPYPCNWVNPRWNARGGIACVPVNAAQWKHLSNVNNPNPIAAAAEAQRLSLLVRRSVFSTAKSGTVACLLIRTS